MAEYDPSLNFWIIRPPTARARRLLTAVAVDGDRLYAIGGETFAGVVNELATFRSDDSVEAFDAPTGRWLPGTPMPTARHSTAAVALNGRIYVIGGSSSNTQSSSTARSVPLALMEEGTPIQSSQPPMKRRRAAH